jgi:hypothetical protein
VTISEHKRVRQRQGRNGSGYNAAEKFIKDDSPMLFKKPGNDGLYEKYGFLVIQHGSDIKNSRGHNSGRGGVAIILSPEARKAWVAAGSWVEHFGNRILVIEVLLMDANWKPVSVVLASAYAALRSGWRRKRIYSSRFRYST